MEAWSSRSVDADAVMKDTPTSTASTRPVRNRPYKEFGGADGISTREPLAATMQSKPSDQGERRDRSLWKGCEASGVRPGETRHVADTIEGLGDIQPLNLIMDVEVNEHGFLPVVTFYYDRSHLQLVE